jgi:hypothetical protein
MRAIMRKDRQPYPNPINGICEQVLENGMVVGVKGFAENGERELYKVGQFAEGDLAAIVDCSVLMYDAQMDERDFQLLAGERGRFEYLGHGDVYTISNAFLPEGLVVGDKLAPDTANLGKYVKDAANGMFLVRRVGIDFEGQPSTMIEVCLHA